ncbi:toprim domain-containing protein [Endozoicomonas sp. ALE010]|uniref:toprim domain-containing protein n=1 Tax=Endozoicomonas sp. ALE010 TaxID=3403081 RepID=UPI003BB56023
MNFPEKYLTVLADNALSPARPINFINDGKIHRYCVMGDRVGSKNGWYVLHGSEVMVAGSWKTSQQVVVHNAELQTLSAHERQQRQRAIQEAQSKAAVEQLRQYSVTARNVKSLWEGSPIADEDHPYLIDKRVSAYGLRQTGDNLLVPLRDASGKIWSVQFIEPNGKKWFAKGGRVRGCFHLIGDPGTKGTLMVCEGYATGASIFNVLDNPVFTAFNAGNLIHAAKAIKEAYGSFIIMMADNDRQTPGNPGITQAMKAALAVNGNILWPPFSEGQPGTDFNDWLVPKGVDHE